MISLGILTLIYFLLNLCPELSEVFQLVRKYNLFAKYWVFFCIRMRKYSSYLQILPLFDIFGWLEFHIVLSLHVLNHESVGFTCYVSDFFWRLPQRFLFCNHKVLGRLFCLKVFVALKFMVSPNL